MTARKTIKRRVEARGKAALYWAKGRRFARAAHMSHEERQWDPAVSMSVNAVINLVDAVCVHFSGARSASDAHDDALDVLEEAGDLDERVREALVRHLSFLLRIKYGAQYDGRLMTAHEADAALTHMDRAYAATEALAKGNEWVAR